MSRPIPVASGTADFQAHTGTATLVGVHVRETAATPGSAALVLRDGTTTAGPVVALVKLTAGQSVHVSLPAVEITTGVFVDRETGSTELVLYLM